MALLTVVLCLPFSIFLYWECLQGRRFSFLHLSADPRSCYEKIIIKLLWLRCTWEQAVPTTGRPWMEILFLVPPESPGSSGEAEGDLCMQCPGKMDGSFHGRDSWDSRWHQEHCKQSPRSVTWDPPASTRNYWLAAGITPWNLMLAVTLM